MTIAGVKICFTAIGLKSSDAIAETRVTSAEAVAACTSQGGNVDVVCAADSPAAAAIKQVRANVRLTAVSLFIAVAILPTRVTSAVANAARTSRGENVVVAAYPAAGTAILRVG